MLIKRNKIVYIFSLLKFFLNTQILMKNVLQRSKIGKTTTNDDNLRFEEKIISEI